MTHVLIPTVASDLHAAAVILALRRKGHRATPVFGCDLPTRQVVSLRLSGMAPPAVSIADDTGVLTVADVDTVWLRRPAPPVLPDDMHPGDRQIAARELESFARATWSLLAPDAFWVSPLDAQRRAAHKPLQLREAVAAGLRIPPTLVSNDPIAIRALVAGAGPVVYKPFRPAAYAEGAGVALAYTSVITVDDLPDDDTLRLCPGIFQPLLAKRHELRVTCIGDHLIAARLDSQGAEATRVDWRGAGGRVPLEPEELPGPLAHACRRLMRRLGLVSGCIDLVVTPDGHAVFLEVNEQGQWLWLEEGAPSLHLLDRFAELLAQRRLDPTWPAGDVVRFADVEAEAEALVDEHQRRHVAEPIEHIVPEDAADDAAA